HVMHSVNTASTDDPMDTNYIDETVMQSIDAPGVPRSTERYKVGAVVVIIRNVNFDSGLVNGQRAIIRNITRKCITVELLDGKRTIALIPRI
ncbi:hypothetical protein JKP88DRAFT_131732, partial [Tribonema minus]